MKKTPSNPIRFVFWPFFFFIMITVVLFGLFMLLAIETSLFVAIFSVLFALFLLVVNLRYYHEQTKTHAANVNRVEKHIKLGDTDYDNTNIHPHAYIWEIDDTGMIVYISDSVEDVLGYQPAELIDRKYIWELNPVADQPTIRKVVLDSLQNKRTLTSVENEIVKKDGSSITVVTGVFPVFNEKGIMNGIQGWDINISESKRLEHALQESEQKLRSLFQTMDEAFVLHEAITDEKARLINYRILDANPAYERHTGIDVEKFKGELITDVFNVDTPPFFDAYRRVYDTGEPEKFRRYFAPLRKYFSVSIFMPGPNQFGTIFLDITEQTELKETIEYLSYHDKLTGLYNRRYYEENLPFLSSVSQLPLSVILCDLNALKMANDAFGHQFGDIVIKKAAELLKTYKPETAMSARIGGDEFVVLLPQTPYDKAFEIMTQLKDASNKVKINDIYMSMSFGMATLKDSSETFENVYRFAENKMYRYKLLEGPKVKRETLKIIEKRLFDEFEHEEGHADDCQNLCLRLGKTIGLDGERMETLSEVAHFHDIGKIAISKALFKSNRALTQLERIEIERHAEIGFSLLSSIPEKAHLAEHVLSHHENIDGSGYPRRLKGDEISLYAKIVRICDSFDAMVSERPYKKTKTKETALKELQTLKDVYYDAKLVDAFVDMMTQDKAG